MGEAKRRKEMGLLPRDHKQKAKSSPSNLFTKYPKLPFILILLGASYLVYDLIKYYTS